MSSYNEFAYIMQEALGTGLISGLFSAIPSFLFSIASYVLTALSLYTIAKRRGIQKPWLSWIPVVNAWTLGSLSDQYRYVVKGENKSKRKALLILNIFTSLLSAAIIVAAIVMVVNLVINAMYYGTLGEEEILELVMGPVLGIAGMSLPLAGVAIAYAVLYYMALYDVYTSCDPSNNVLFLVLSVIFNVTQPFFLLACRNKDKGMPPRKPASVPFTPQPEPVYEPWENKDYL